jgi:DNA gyrase subunit A
MADLFGEKVINVPVEDEIKKSYLDYSMSVIIGRALPDVRDGLKPVHRRILFAMNEMGCLPNRPYKKSARVVGEVLGKFHPHGDVALYDTLVRMAQPFSLRYPLVDGHGNFGSIDGDAPAAMRYTEARLSPIAMELLDGLNEESVDFVPNFDNTLKEPVVLPAKFPNLLANGSSGIAVGMATNIPPHNLSELTDALVDIIDREKLKGESIEPEELLKFIKGPDFPTAGSIIGHSGIREYFLTGRGIITIRGKGHIEPIKHSKRVHYVITELPYEVNKATLVEKIANLVKAKKLRGIEDIRDESDRDGIRVVIKLSPDVNINVFENNLRVHTQFEKRYGVILLGILNNVPKVFTMKELLLEFLSFREEVVLRRAKFQLKKAEEHLEILLGLEKAILNIDNVIKIIRGSNDSQIAAEKLKELLSISDSQVKAILDMKLSRLTNLEQKKLTTEIGNTKNKISELEELLHNKNVLWNKIKEDLLRVKGKFGDKRRTNIIDEEGDINIEDLIEDKPVVISITKDGYIKRMPEDTFKVQKRGGKGIIAQSSSEEDSLRDIFSATTKSRMLFFTNKGKVYSLKVYEIPESRRESKGASVYRLIRLSSDEKITAAIPLVEKTEVKSLLLVTKRGTGKRVSIKDFERVMSSGKIAINLSEGDELVSVVPLFGEEDYIIITAKGYSIRTSSKEVREMGRNARGVGLIKLVRGDYVVSADAVSEDTQLFIVTEKGYGKRTRWGDIRKIRRRGKGVKCIRVNEKTGLVKGTLIVNDDDKIVVISKNGNMIKFKVSSVRVMGRTAMGVRVIKFKQPDDSVASIDTTFE